MFGLFCVQTRKLDEEILSWVLNVGLCVLQFGYKTQTILGKKWLFVRQKYLTFILKLPKAPSSPNFCRRRCYCCWTTTTSSRQTQYGHHGIFETLRYICETRHFFISMEDSVRLASLDWWSVDWRVECQVARYTRRRRREEEDPAAKSSSSPPWRTKANNHRSSSSMYYGQGGAIILQTTCCRFDGVGVWSFLPNPSSYTIYYCNIYVIVSRRTKTHWAKAHIAALQPRNQ